ncbi:MAG TPA: hypothetical protein PLK90_00985 [Clostridiales bacterium]|nr:hypothetical protein [Clostridiales bacterium]HQP68951.1 hypothetical protein [Clostridiales bacterium]
MHKFYTIILLAAVSVLISSETAGMAGAFLRYGLDARSESLGRAVTADTNSGFSIFFNPAAASSILEKQVLTGMKILSMDRRFAYLSYLHPVKNRAVISAGLLYSGTADIEARDKYGDQFDTYSYNENMFYLNFGIKPKEFLSIGVTTKLIWVRLPEFDTDGETVSSLTFAYDLGCDIFIPGTEGLTAGISVRNVKGKNSWNSDKVWTDGSASTDYYPASYSMGVSWIPEFNKEIGIYGDINSSDLEDYGYGLGIEWQKRFDEKKSAVAFRTGTVSGSITAGFGYEFSVMDKKMIIDYAYTHEDISEFNPHSLSWRVFF